jgi:hypothetical protein
VTDITALRYRAFLSYSHADMAWAKWLHRALESYRIDNDLMGRETTVGPVPKSLRPIFRDREDFAAGHSLSEQTLKALEASDFLVVICSPNAARSKYLDEEIRRFKALGHAARVIPIIVDGEPGHPQDECFPPAVRFKIARDGELTSEHEEPIAADARPHGDGKEIAKRKVIAGLLGVGFDEIARRAERAQRRRNLLRGGIGLFAVVLVAAIAFTGCAMDLFSGQLSVAEDLNSVRDAAGLCEEAAITISRYDFPEGKRIMLASECVDTFNQFLSDLPSGTPVPMRVETSLKRYLAVLRTFEAQHKLTPHQSDTLGAAETFAAQIDRQ